MTTKYLVVLLLLGCDDGPKLPVDDADGDGVALPYDCDDEDPRVCPGLPEVCDGLDNDCDFETDEEPEDGFLWYVDGDGDGYGLDGYGRLACLPEEGEIGQPGDCDDADDEIAPLADELCDGVDNDCDGEVDEDAAEDATAWHPDEDGDGDGADSEAWYACEQPEGYVSNDQDCDDADPENHRGAQELCDGVDNDCDGDVDEDAADAQTWYADEDGDGFGDRREVQVRCEVPSGCVANFSDCDDLSAQNHPGAPELCDALDNDCDLALDEDAVDAPTWYRDADGDGYTGTDAASARVDCEAPEGYGDDGEDCDDADAAISPDGQELCGSGVDEDCDGELDPCALRVLLRGETEGEQVGCALAAAEDVSGDGLPDLWVGACGAGVGGAVYLLPGPLEEELSVSELERSWTGAATDGAGAALAGGEDADGDALPDLLVGGPESDRGADDGGAAWLSYGAAEGGGLDDAEALVVGDEAGMGLGGAVALSADSGWDGSGAALIGASGDDEAGADAGLALLYLGAPMGSLSPEDADAVFLGETEGDEAGETLQLGVDFDADGIGDVIVGASQASHDGPEAAGRVYLSLGPVSGSLSLSDADAILGGAVEGERAGRGLCAPGDLDGDGYQDLVVGAPFGDGEESGSGLVYLVRGPLASGGLSALASATLLGAVAEMRAGWSVSAGDVNGDGAADLAVGAPYAGYEGELAGAAWVALGPFSGATPLDELEARVPAETAGDQTGRAVLIPGDVDGDGLDDLAVGAHRGSLALDRAGALFLIPGW